MRRPVKILLTVLAVLTGAVIIAASVSLLVLRLRTDALRTDIDTLRASDKYRAPVSAPGVEVITQEVSCGYAVLEMFAAWNGDALTESALYSEYGRVVTSTGKAFSAEMNKRFLQFKTTLRSWLTDAELIDAVYGCLAEGVPVPFEWAAQYETQWTLHYSLVVGMDVPGDTVTVANPYGYTETLTLAAFLERTRFDAYTDMPLFLKLGFAFGIFEKNAVFTVERREGA